MKVQFCRERRFVIAATAVLCAGLLFRQQIAQALVVRGDDCLYQGDRPCALAHYTRALAFDPGSSVAVDRFVFVEMQRHDAASLERAIHVATRYIETHRTDAVVVADRATCFLVERRYPQAYSDFRTAHRLLPQEKQFSVAVRILRHRLHKNA